MQNACEVDMDMTGVVNVTSGDTGEIPTFDLTAMGVKPDEFVDVDTTALYEALTSGRPVRCTYDYYNSHYVWVGFVHTLTQGSYTFATFMDLIVREFPTFVYVRVGASSNPGIKMEITELQPVQKSPVN